MCIWQQCNKDPSTALGMTVLGERIDSQGRLRRLFRRWYSRIAAFPSRGGFVWQRLRRLFLLGRCLEVAFKSPVTSHSIIRRKGSAYMRGMRSFDSVLTCSGRGFLHMGRFRPLRMTIRGGRVASQTWMRNWYRYIEI